MSNSHVYGVGNIAVTHLTAVCPQCGTQLRQPSPEPKPILRLVAVECYSCGWTGQARFWTPQVVDADV